jgi:glc operon protein GlcG
MRAWRGSAAALALTAVVAAGARAQVVEKKTLSLDGAKRAIAAAVAEAKRLKTTGVIAVVDDGGNLMAVERIDNTFAAGANISIGKARTAVIFKRPTRVFEEIIKNGRTPMVALSDFTPLQGGVPIEVDGQIVGGIGVSGAASAQQDEELAIAGASALRPMTTASAGQTPSPTVTFIDGKEVALAFQKGAVLVNQGDFMVHASHRDGAGMAEVHTRDTDVIYVLDGTAQFVTGGAVVDGKSAGPEEIRGAAIQGGERRRIARGDVLVVPNGTPHWFQEVKGPFNYYVVKVRSAE